MKKLLRNLSIAALVAMLSTPASAELVLTQQWYMNSSTIGDTWKSETNPGNNVRFPTAKDGKIYGIAMDQKKVMSFDKDGKIEPIFDIPMPDGIIVPGSILAIDQAGNYIFNYNFIQSNPSPSQMWGVYNPTTKKATTFTIPADQVPVQRIDRSGRVIGDATSAEGAYMYVFGVTYDGAPIMYHFTGDGTQMTKVTATPTAAADAVALQGFNFKYNASGEKNIPQYAVAQPKYETIAEMKAGNPAQNIYAVLNAGAVCTFENGAQVTIGSGDFTVWTSKHIIGTVLGGFDTFVLNGKRYFVRQYDTTWNFSPGPSTIDKFVVQDENCAIVASWQVGDFSNWGSGCGTIVCEKVSDSKVNIYTYATGGGKGSQAAMCTFEDTDVVPVVPEPEVKLQGKGTEQEPYIIATAEDLCNAWTGHKKDATVYYKQTADIDMKDVTEYHAVLGYNGVYDCSINYDGGNHVIRNFAPVDREAINEDPVMGNNYYCTTVFGVVTGEIKNLGIIDADCHAFASAEVMGCGIMGAYVGHDLTPVGNATITNCFVTGKAKSDASYCGGMFGTTGGVFATANPSANNKITISDSYTNVTVEGTIAGGVIGRLRNDTKMTNVYTQAVVTGSTSAGLVAASDKTDRPLTVTNVVALGTGAATNGPVVDGTITTAPAGDATAIATIKTWSAFNAGKMLDNLPTLNWMTDAQITSVDEVAADNENAPVEYYNLQGVRVENPSHGLYIKRHGSKAVKVVL